MSNLFKPSNIYITDPSILVLYFHFSYQSYKSNGMCNEDIIKQAICIIRQCFSACDLIDK